MIAENLPIAYMGVVANKHRVIMYFPSSITRSQNPQAKFTYHPEATVGKTNGMVIVGFKELKLHELNACDLSTQDLRY